MKLVDLQPTGRTEQKEVGGLSWHAGGREHTLVHPWGLQVLKKFPARHEVPILCDGPGELTTRESQHLQIYTTVKITVSGTWRETSELNKVRFLQYKLIIQARLIDSFRVFWPDRANPGRPGGRLGGVSRAGSARYRDFPFCF